jgi:hypothetical protein
MRHEQAPLAPRDRTSDWPFAMEGWRVVGNGRNIPGFASEKSAKIAIRKNTDWQAREATIVPFTYSDGGVVGCSKYAELHTRYAVCVRQPLTE